MSYIKLDRKILEWEWFNDIVTTHLWLYILLKANHQVKEWHGVVIPEGSFITSEAKLSANTGLSREQVRRALNKLMQTNEITKRTTKTHTQITVNKWAVYQCSGETPTKKTTNKPTSRTTSESTNGSTTTKEIKKERIQEDIYKGKSERFISTLNDFKEMRKNIKKPMSQKAVEMLIEKLNKLATDEETQIKIMEQSIFNSWQGIFPLKNEPKAEKPKTSYEEMANAWKNY